MKFSSALIFATTLTLASANLVRDGICRGDEFPFVHVPLANVEDYASDKVHMMMVDAMTSTIDEIRSEVVNATDIFESILGIPPVTECMPYIDGYAGNGNNTYMCNILDL
ncbi:MYND-type domain-containing protein [Mycena venus]|uniref:MYND-type domain-containing protein n=1 Tax=Mycena venus TaxID=2733690 RepID=A0A8H6X945_9AGAR|nr:MYND-type domain-containing protein [Mycena venus]